MAGVSPLYTVDIGCRITVSFFYINFDVDVYICFLQTIVQSQIKQTSIAQAKASHYGSFSKY